MERSNTQEGPQAAPRDGETMHVAMPAHGLWATTAPPPPTTSPLSGDLRADVAIIGGGFTGLSAALHLAEHGVRVVLLEGAEIGFGGSGRNVGLVNAGMWVMPDDLASLLGPPWGERLLGLLGDAPDLVFSLIRRHGIACEAERNGTLHLAVGATGLLEIEQRHAQWHARGALVELLDADETAKRVGSTAYAGALLDWRAGTLQPLAYARGLAKAAIAAGAEIFTRSPVTGARREGGTWRLATQGGSVSAPQIVVATNAYTEGVWPDIRAELVALPYFNMATPPLPDALREKILPARHGCWDTKAILSSFRLDQAGRLVFGSVGALRGTGTAVHRAWAKRALKHIFPALGPVTFESEWHGRIGMTEDALPRLHRPAPGVIGFSGYNGRGIAPGTVFGRALAQLLTGALPEEAMPLPVTGIRRAPLRLAKEGYYELGAQIAHLSAGRFGPRKPPRRPA